MFEANAAPVREWSSTVSSSEAPIECAEPTAVSLFSGCGGFDLGAVAAKVKVAYAIDAMADAATSLKRNLPDTDVVHNRVEVVKTLPKADLLFGGYPCQSFSMGGRRAPATDARSKLYLEFARCLGLVEPLYFIAENVSGLVSLGDGEHFARQIKAFKGAGTHGYRVSWAILDAADFGVPQHRRRLFIVGVRKDLARSFAFPEPTHGREGLPPFASHGDVLGGLPLWPEGEFYTRPGGMDDIFPWYYMSRNRKARWDAPSYTVVANWRHVTLHPASPAMKMTWSNLKDGWKQRWDFTEEYEHTATAPDRPKLEQPRRLSWRECGRIQTFPDTFEPAGSIQSKYTQIGNAVPPKLAEAVLRHLLSGHGLVPVKGRKRVV